MFKISYSLRTIQTKSVHLEALSKKALTITDWHIFYDCFKLFIHHLNIERVLCFIITLYIVIIAIHKTYIYIELLIHKYLFFKVKYLYTYIVEQSNMFFRSWEVLNVIRWKAHYNIYIEQIHPCVCFRQKCSIALLLFSVKMTYFARHVVSL